MTWTDGSKLERIQKLEEAINKEMVTLFEPSSLTGKDLINAGRSQEQNLTDWEDTLTFSQEGGEKFAKLTKSIAGTSRL